MAWMPGEDLLIKVIDTLERGAVGCFKPRQIAREEKARREARRDELLLLAQAEKDIEDIKNNKKALDDNGQLVALPSPDPSDETDKMLLEYKPTDLIEDHHKETLVLDFQRAINLRYVNLFAQEEAETLGDDPVSEEQVDPDWFSSWRERAQNVSREEMQRLWAKVLVGEVRAPGTFSAHSMDFLSRMSMQDANLLSRLAGLSLGDWIYSGAKKSFEQQSIAVSDLIYLNDIGIINGVIGIGGLSKSMAIQADPNRVGYGDVVVKYGSKAFVFSKEETKGDVSVPAYSISSIGREILSLTVTNHLDVYIQELVEYMKSKGFSEAKLGNLIRQGSQMGISNMEDITV